MPNWTKEQGEAIYADEKNILVSAAAGSGKTAVLTERIVTMLTREENPVEADGLLVVTFTNAAAAEMRERVINKLNDRLKSEPENKLLRRQLSLIHTASITTIHSFCLNIIRENFIPAGVDPAFKIADTTENEILKLEAVAEAFDEMFEDEAHAEAFIRLSDNYSNGKNIDSLSDIATDVYDFAISLPEPEKWLDTSSGRFGTEEDFDSGFYAEIITEHAKNALGLIVSEYEGLIEKAENDDDVPAVSLLLKEEKSMFSEGMKCNTYSELYEFFQNIEFKAFPRVKKEYMPVWREQIKAVRESIKDTVRKKITESFFNLSAEEQKKAMKELAPLVAAFSEFIKKIIKIFNEKKAKKNILNFNDLEHICYRLFVDENGKRTEIAKQTEKRFSEILIDEYQDTSRLQEAIFSAIHNENRMFMVGDIKQSIYRFRNTDPLLFRSKSDRFVQKKGENCRKILLSKNFRSRKEVIEAVNFFFLRLMSRGAGEVDYNEEEKLYSGASFAECVNPINPSCEICITDRAMEAEEDETLAELSAAELEAEVAADKIEELISGGYEITDKGTARKISYKDICILMRSTKGTAAIFAEVLAKRGIPVFSDAGGVFLNSGEIDTVMNFLKVTDNPHQDIPLIGVLRSPLFYFTTNELAEIRAQKPESDFFTALLERSLKTDETAKRINAFLTELNGFRLKAKVLPTHELIWEIYMKTGIYDYVGATKNGALKQANLRVFYTRAQEYDSTGFKGLYSFIRFIEGYKETGSDFSAAKLVGEEQDVVRIMSIHKSKGLEFPAVILACTGKRFNMRDVQKPFLYHANLGFGPKMVDDVLRITYPTAAKSAIASVITGETLSEEMRILYVALTRAKEKLIISGCVNKLQTAVSKWLLGENGSFKIDKQRALSASSYLDWIGMCLLNHPQAKVLLEKEEHKTACFESNASFKINIFAPKSETTEKNAEKTEENAETADIPRILELINKKYLKESYLNIPSKITVTELKRRMAEEEESFYLFKPDFAEISSEQGVENAAKLGTAYHTVMEHMDFSRDVSKTAVMKKTEELKNEGFITEEEQKNIDIDKISRFFTSDIFKRIRKVEKIEREVMFAIKEKACDLGIANSEAEVVVQGVIDLAAISENEVFILDYKTDRNITEAEAAEKYKIQLMCYGFAVKKLYKKEAKTAYIYLFETGKTAEVSLE